MSNERTFTARLVANVASFVAKMREASQSTSGFSKEAQAKFDRVGTKLQDVGGKMTTRLTLPLVAAGGASLKMFADFDSSMTKIQSLVGLSASEVDSMRDSVLDLAGTTAKSPQELADALFVVTSAGLRGADAMDALEMAAKAGAAGLGETNDIARAVAGAMNAYGPGTLDAARATDVLTATARAGNFETSQLAGSLGRVLPFAKQAGASIEDVGGAVALLTRTNGDAAESVTQVNGLMRAFVTPTAEAKKILDGLGMTAADVREHIGEHGLVATLQMLDEKLGGNREALGQLIGRAEGTSAAYQILDANAATLEATFGEVSNSIGLTNEAFGITSDTAAFKMQQAWTEVQTALIEAGSIIMPILAGVAGAVANVASFFADLPGPVQTAVIAFLGVAAAIGPLLKIVGTLYRSFMTLKAGLIALKAAMVAHPLMALATVAAAVGTAVFLMGRQSSGAAEEVKKLADEMRDAGDAGEGLTRYLSSIIEDSDPLLTAMANVGLTVEDLSAAVQAGGDEYERFTTKILESAEAAGTDELMLSALSKLLDDLPERTAAATDKMEDKAAVLGDVADATGDAADATDDYTDATDRATGASAALVDMSGEQRVAIRESGERAEEAAGRMESYQERLDEINADLEDQRSEIQAWADDINSSAQQAAGSFGDFSDEGSKTIAGFVSDLNSQSGDVAAWQENLVEIAARTSPEFAAYLADMGESGAGLVEQLAERGDLEDVHNAWLMNAEVLASDMAARYDEVGPGITEKMEAAETAAMTAMSETQAAMELEAAHFAAVGTAMAEGVALGIVQGTPTVTHQASVMIAQAVSRAQVAARVSSPSKLFAEKVGQPIAAGVAVGVAEDAHKLNESLEKAIDDAADDAVDAARDLVDEVSDQIDALWDRIGDRRDLFDTRGGVADAEARAAEDLAAIAEARMEGEKEIAEAIEAAADARVDAAKGVEDAEYAVTKAERDARLAAAALREVRRESPGDAEAIEAAEWKLAEAKRAVVAANDKLVETTEKGAERVADAEAEIATARVEAAERVTDAEDRHAESLERLKDANLKLAEATAENVNGSAAQRDAWRQTAIAAGLTGSEIAALTNRYRELANAQAAANSTSVAVAAESAAAQATRVRFSELVNQGLVDAARIEHINSFDGNTQKQLDLMAQTIVQLEAFFTGVAGRAGGGPVMQNRLYRVGESNRNELLNTNRGQFLIPGDNGHITPISNLVPAVAVGAGQGGGRDGNVYQISVNVPLSHNKGAVGREIVEAVGAYERSNGNSWRTTT